MKKHLIKTVLLIVLLLLAIVLGIIIGDACTGVHGLSWLAATASFGLAPTTLDLSVLQFTNRTHDKNKCCTGDFAPCGNNCLLHNKNKRIR